MSESIDWSVAGPAGDEYARSLSSVGKGAGVMVLGTVLLLAFSFLGRVAVARAYGPSGWGEFNIGLAILGFLSLTALLGLSQALARSLSFESDPTERRALIRWTLWVTIAASVVVSATVYFLAGPIASAFPRGANAPQLTAVIQLFSVAIGFTMISTLLAAVFQGFEDVFPNAWFNGVVTPGLFLVFVGLVLVFHWGFVAAMAAYTASLGAGLAAFVVYTLRKLPRYLPPSDAPPSPRRTPLAGLALSFWGISSLSFVTAYADTLILGVFSNTDIVGQYSSAMTLARLLLVGNGALTYIYLPVAARLAATKDIPTIRRTFVTATRWTLAVTLPMLLIFVVFPGQSLFLVFGPGYAPAQLSMIILVIGSFISVLLGPVNSAMGGMGYTRALLATTALSATANFVLCLALIPTLGMLGAALAWAVARILYPASGLASLYRSDRISPFGRILTVPVIVTLGISLPAYYALSLLATPDWVVIPLYLVGVGVFLGAILLTRSLDPGDLMVATAAERVLGRPLPGLRAFLSRHLPSGTDLEPSAARPGA